MAFPKALGSSPCGSQPCCAPHRSTGQGHCNCLRILPVKLADWLCGWYRDAGPPGPGRSALGVAGGLEKFLFSQRGWGWGFGVVSRFHIPCYSPARRGKSRGGKLRGGSEGAGGISFA